jgi:hypothetical protein
MKKTTKKKAFILAKYSGMWAFTLFLGFVTFVFVYSRNVCLDCVREAYFFLGVFAGIFGAACYFMLCALLTPIGKWIWGKIRHKPQSFIKLIK